MNSPGGPVDLTAVQRDDGMIDNFNTSTYTPTGDLLRDTLMAWRADAHRNSDRELVDVDTATTVFRAARDRPYRIMVRLMGSLIVIIVVGALLAILAGCGTPEPIITVPAGPLSTSTGAIPSLPLAGPPPAVASVTEIIPPYDELAFGGSRWATVLSGPDGKLYGPNCDVRETVLAQHSAQLGTPVDRDRDGCADDGKLPDLYTAHVLDPTTDRVQVDHVFAQADAWRMGAYRWSREQLWAFRNDQANLRATLGSVNASKGDRGPDEWRPEARSGWCGYAQIYLATASRWQLRVTPQRRVALDDMLTTCTPGA